MNLNREKKNGATFTINGINLAIDIRYKLPQKCIYPKPSCYFPHSLSGFDIFCLSEYKGFTPLNM